jgi:hypothetical protein
MSTSLSDLPLPGGMQMQMPEQQNFDLNKMIDEAATQVQQGDEPNLSSGALQYQLDKSQIPMNGPVPNIQMQEQQYQMEQPQYMYEMEPEPEVEKTFMEKLTSDAKIPLLVAVLFVILSMPQFNRVLTRFVPRFLSETGDLNMVGLAAKGLLLALLVFVAKYFL